MPPAKLLLALLRDRLDINAARRRNHLTLQRLEAWVRAKVLADARDLHVAA